MAGNLSNSLVFLVVLSIIAVGFIGSRIHSMYQRKPTTHNNISSLSSANASLTCPSSRSNYLTPVFNGEGEWSGYYVPMP